MRLGEVQGFGHERHDVRLGDGLAVADRDRVVGIGERAHFRGHEFLARRFEENFQDGRIPDTTGRNLIANHLGPPEVVGLREGDQRSSHHAADALHIFIIRPPAGRQVPPRAPRLPRGPAWVRADQCRAYIREAAGSWAVVSQPNFRRNNGKRGPLVRDNAFMNRIRRAVPGDLAALFDLTREFARSFQPQFEIFEQSFHRLMQQDDALLLVIDDAGELLGYLLGFDHPTLYANGRVSWVEEIMVRAERRRGGFGRNLMLEFEQWAATRESRLVALATRRAAPFYTAIGYQESAIYFRKLLGTP